MNFIQNKHRKNLIIAVFLFLLIFLFCLDLLQGSKNIALNDIFSCILNSFNQESFLSKNPDISQDYVIIKYIRLPRAILAVFVGIALSTSGVAMQSMFRNSLADPSITGVSSGSALGAALAISVFGAFSKGQINENFLPLWAIAFGLLTVIGVYKISLTRGKISVPTMLLGAMSINAFSGALIGFIIYSSTSNQIKSLSFWYLGSLERASWSQIWVCVGIVVVCFSILFSLSKSLNALFFGENQAYYMGVNVKRTNFLIIFTSACMTGASVAICGIIGFVGLIVPHIARLFIGANNRYVLPLSGIMGGAILLFADIASRLVSSSNPAPTGVITAIIGAPFFMIMILLSKKKLENLK